MSPRSRAHAVFRIVVLLLAAALCGERAQAQDAGSTEVLDGTIQGRISDNETSAPVEGVTVTVIGPILPDEDPKRVVRSTNAEGLFELRNVPAGRYEILFERDGYRPSKLPELVVGADQIVRADLRILPRPEDAPEPEVAPAPTPGPDGAPGPAPDVEEFVVLAPPLAEIMAASRMDADELINTLSAEDFAKFAASDVADALKFVPGVNVVEGQFAIIRGLEDRYNSTLYNFAPVPSPDPDSQSVQLDLFPAEIVSNLVVAKTFAPDLPSNSSGGAIDIITHDYPEEFEVKLSSGTGFNSRAWDRFLEFERNSPVGIEEDGWATIEREFGLSLGGRRDLLDREIRFKGVLNREIDFQTGEGTQEKNEPITSAFRRFPPPGRVTRSGDLSLGELSLSGGKFDFTESDKETQNTAYGGLGFDLDSEANHKIDGSFFYTKKKEEIVQLLENGTIPGFDYSTLAGLGPTDPVNASDTFEEFSTLSSWIAHDIRDIYNEPISRGPVWFANFSESSSFSTDRDVWVGQINGDHRVAQLEGLHFSWAGNKAKTTQSEEALGSRFFYEPFDLTSVPDTFPAAVEELGAGQYYANSGLYTSSNDITENQWFGRFDVDYERELIDELTFRFGSGFWYERAKRDVASSFLESPTVDGRSEFAIEGGGSPQELGRIVFDALDQDEGALSGLRDATSEGDRKIRSYYFDGKATLFDRVDLLGGVRFERIRIVSNNDPFTGEINPADGSPSIFPSKYVFFDRQDNPANGEFVPTPLPENFTFNDQLLGIDVPVDPVTGLVDLLDRESISGLVNGLIDEDRVFPSAGFTIRPLEGMNLRGAFSETVARPSFRELGYYVSVEPATDDLVVGNPQLQLSDVRSWDLRAEYVWGDLGDLVAVSGFRKRIETPIESIIVRDQANFEATSNAFYRTFFNNQNTGKLWGIEAEARKAFDFIPLDPLQYLSLGGNFTYIWAKVGRSEVEIQRAAPFFGVAEGDEELFDELAPTRRLFNQPKWIGSADLSFDHPDWGTKVTLSFFAISDLLDAAGSVSLLPDGQVIAFVPDRYVDSYYSLDLIASQTFSLGFMPGDLTLKLDAKNLTDSVRRLVYDKEQTRSEIAERSIRMGRDYSFSLTYTFRF